MMLIKNCRILEGSRIIDTNILIENNKIKKIIKNIKDIKADREIDAKNNIVLPGIIDSHVHFREPGLTQKEDFLSGSKAAVSGGVTTILDMPNTKPETITAKALEEKRKLAEKSVANYGFYFGAAKDNIDEIKKAKNIAAVKLYMDISTGDMRIDDGKTLEELFKNSKIVAVHAEGDNIKKAVALAKKYGTRLYICHVSTKEGIDFISKNKTNKIFVEVTPHSLFLTKRHENKLIIMKPCLGTKTDQIALWNAIKNNIVDTIATDHAPHLIEEKKKGICYGIPGVETLLPLILNAVNRKRLTLQKLQQLCCENPAKIFGIKNKGFIKPGFDADLVVVDMQKEKTVKNNELFTKCKWSPFNGFKLRGWPVMTIVNGNIVYDNGKINDIKGREVVFNA